MAIEITEFANVSISVSPVGVGAGNFGILGFLTSDSDLNIAGKGILPAERARSYTSLASVGGDWQASSEVYKAATAFFSQTPTPTDFLVKVCYETAQPSTLVGGGSDTAAELIAATWNGSGELSMNIEGVDVVITDLDVSGAATSDYAGVAGELEAIISAIVVGTTVTHNGYQFVVTAPTSGVSSTMTAPASTEATVALGLAVQLASVSPGITVETPVDALAATLAKGIVDVGLVTNKKWRDVVGVATGSSTTDIAMWAEGAKRIFCNTTNDLTTLTSGTSHIAADLKSRALRFSLTTFSKDATAYPSASVFGRAASVNFSAIGSTITLNLKQMPGIAAENLTPSEFASMKSHFCSAVVQIGSSVSAYTDSRMASGSWLDTTHGILWLENRCEADMFNLLYVSGTKLPYTQVGINTAAATLERSLQAAVRNGLAGPGTLADGTYLSEGFVVESVSLANTPVSDKGNRMYKGLSFKMVGAGAMHEVEVSGQFSE